MTRTTTTAPGSDPRAHHQPDPVKTQLVIPRHGTRRRINCHPHERQFMARLARARRADARAGRSPRLTLDALRTIAANRYA